MPSFMGWLYIFFLLVTGAVYEFNSNTGARKWKDPSTQMPRWKEPGPQGAAPNRVVAGEGARPLRSTSEQHGLSSKAPAEDNPVPETRMPSLAPQRAETQPSRSGLPPNCTQESKGYLGAGPTSQHGGGELSVPGRLPLPNSHVGRGGSTRGENMG